MPTNPNSPFDPGDNNAYRRWRDAKLHGYPTRLDALIVEIRDPHHPTAAELDAIRRRCAKTNMAIWTGLSGHDRDKRLIRSLGHRFGLERLDRNPYADKDAITSLTVQPDALKRGYIPYSNRPLAWHTDGYYNTPREQIHAVLLHCVRPADEGGENALLDHEILYLLIRDENPDYIRALMHPEALTIPANVVDGKEIRPARGGPVFSIRPDGHLHMRYTDRERSIAWRDDPLLRDAVIFLKQTLKTPTPWHFRGRLDAGQGLISNNVLHARAGFKDHGEQRLLYRARYFDRISTG